MDDFRMPGDGSFSLGSRTWPGLSKLVEECGEVLQIAGKIMGTGGAVQHWDGKGDLDERIALELCDLFAAARAFFQLNGFDGNPVYIQREIQKYRQFLKWHSENLPDKDDSITEEIQALDAMLESDPTWPVSFPEANAVLFGTPEDRASGKVIDLPIHRYEDAEGKPHVISKWKLSADELSEVMRTGHVSFFYDKALYLRKRYAALKQELDRRGINYNRNSELDPDGVFDALDERFRKDYNPTPEALALVRARIAEKIAMKPSWYRYKGKPNEQTV